MEMLGLCFWFATGAIGGFIQWRWYKRNGYKQDTPILDCLLNLIFGPIGLVAALFAYH